MTFSLFSRAPVHSPAPASIIPSPNGDGAADYHQEKQDAQPSIHFAACPTASALQAGENRCPRCKESNGVCRNEKQLPGFPRVDGVLWRA
jgi:hypothetical protein